MDFKKIIHQIHLWLGLLSALVVFVSMFAAAIFVWDKELTHWYYSDYIFVNPQSDTPLQPLSQLFEKAREAVPGKEVSGVEIFNDPEKSYVFSTFQRHKQATGIWHASDYAYWDKIYIDPYTGKVQGVVNMLTNPVDLTRRLHQNLLLRYDIGHYIVGFATLFVMILALTGLYLWFPKNKAAFKQRFTVKWNARWRRVNYDIHNVGGFYTHLLILFLSITGLVWTFDWWTDGIYRLLGDDPKTVFSQHTHVVPKVDRTPAAHPVDIAFTDMLSKRANWIDLFLDLSYEENNNTVKEISGYLGFNQTGWDDGDTYYYEGQSGKLIHQVIQEQKTIGEAWRNSNYAMHVGSIYGLPTQLLACFSALFLAFLPISGILIWWGRRNKPKKKTKSAAVTQSRKAVTVRG